MSLFWDIKVNFLESLEVYLILLPLVLLYFYFIPAGIFYYFFYKRTLNSAIPKIQSRYPSDKSIINEIKGSVLSLVLFSFLGTLLYEIWKHDYTKIYFSLSEHSLGYTILSFFILLILHDSYFYWVHRFMHLTRLYKYVHKLHHKSVTPTPWAVYRFQPLETIIQFAIYPLILVFIPIHIGVLALFLTYNILVNTGGHTGFEFIPQWMRNHWFFKWSNSVTHHDIHHSKFNYNFGLYFNFWDRIMGTFLNDQPKEPTLSDSNFR